MATSKLVNSTFIALIKKRILGVTHKMSIPRWTMIQMLTSMPMVTTSN